MDLIDLAKDFKLTMKHVDPFTCLTLNGKTTILNNKELEDLEHGLTNLSHAISLYKRDLATHYTL